MTAPQPVIADALTLGERLAAVVGTAAGLIAWVVGVAFAVHLAHTSFADLLDVHVAPRIAPAQKVALTPVPLGPDTSHPLVTPSLLVPYIDRGPR